MQTLNINTGNYLRAYTDYKSISGDCLYYNEQLNVDAAKEAREVLEVRQGIDADTFVVVIEHPYIDQGYTFEFPSLPCIDDILGAIATEPILEGHLAGRWTAPQTLGI